MFTKYLKKPLNVSKLALNHSHFQDFLVVMGVGEEDSGSSMLQLGFAILKNGCFSAILVIWNTLSCELDC